MVYFTEMKKLFLVTTTLCLIFLSNINSVRAGSPSFSLYPNTGTIEDTDTGFTLDVLIDSDGEEITEARMALSFDPSVVKVVSASKNNTLFCDWPEEDSSVDNVNGAVLLTGFSQSGESDLYLTEGDPDVFARIEFEILNKEVESITIDWLYESGDPTFTTTLLVEGSPPQNLLSSKPAPAVFSMRETTAQTALKDWQWVTVGGVVMILFGGFLFSSKGKINLRGRETIVLRDE